MKAVLLLAVVLAVGAHHSGAVAGLAVAEGHRGACATCDAGAAHDGGDALLLGACLAVAAAALAAPPVRRMVRGLITAPARSHGLTRPPHVRTERGPPIRPQPLSVICVLRR